MTSLHRPAASPDELDLGYLGLVMHRNGFEDESETQAAVVRFAAANVSPPERRSDTSPTLIEALAEVAGVGAEDFVYRHTMLPLQQALVRRSTDRTSVCHASSSVVGWYLSTAKAAGFRFCHECVSRDLATTGIAWWRRSHQVPGRCLCPEHLVSLRIASRPQDVLRAPEHAADSTEISEELARRAHASTSVNRFLEIADALLDSRPLRDSRLLKKLLDRRIGHLRAHAGRPCPSPCAIIGRAIRQAFPADWLALAFAPTPYDSGSLVDSLERTTQWDVKIPARANLLAATVLFDTSQGLLDALDELQNGADETLDLEGGLLRLQPRPNVGAPASDPSDAGDISLRRLQAWLQNLSSDPFSIAHVPGLRRAAYAFFVSGKSFVDSANEGPVPLESLEHLVRSAAPGLAAMLADGRSDARTMPPVRRGNVRNARAQ